jgi:tetratricopeptide (TPR) repeat protein
LQAALQDVVFFKTDAEKGEGLELAKKYSVKGYPTFLLADAEGAAINVWAGYGDVPSYISTLAGALADLTTIDQRRERFASQPSAADAEVLAGFHSARDEYKESVGFLRRALALDPDGTGKYDSRIFNDIAYGYLNALIGRGDPLFEKSELIAAADAVVNGRDPSPDKLIQVAGLMQLVAGRSQEAALALPYLEAAVERTEGSQDPGVQSARQPLLVDYALQVEGNPQKALDLKRTQMKEGWQEDPAAINSFAWWCFENKVNLEEAETLARRGVELAPAGKDRAMILDTLAEICHARGKTDEALAMIRRAVEEAPDEGYYQQQLARFEAAGPTS